MQHPRNIGRGHSGRGWTNIAPDWGCMVGDVHIVQYGWGYMVGDIWLGIYGWGHKVGDV